MIDKPKRISRIELERAMPRIEEIKKDDKSLSVKGLYDILSKEGFGVSYNQLYKYLTGMTHSTKRLKPVQKKPSKIMATIEDILYLMRKRNQPLRPDQISKIEEILKE